MSCRFENRRSLREVVPIERLIALLEAAKAVLVGLAGLGILSLIHRDVHLLAARLIEHLHLNPAKKYPHIFLSAASNIGDPQIVMMAALALVYAVVHGAEAYGLWQERRWAEWLGALSGAIYIPFEIYELCKGASWLKWTALFINVGIVTYLGLKLRFDPRSAECRRRASGMEVINSVS